MIHFQDNSFFFLLYINKRSQFSGEINIIIIVISFRPAQMELQEPSFSVRHCFPSSISFLYTCTVQPLMQGACPSVYVNGMYMKFNQPGITHFSDFRPASITSSGWLSAISCSQSRWEYLSSVYGALYLHQSIRWLKKLCMQIIFFQYRPGLEPVIKIPSSNVIMTLFLGSFPPW